MAALEFTPSLRSATRLHKGRLSVIFYAQGSLEDRSVPQVWTNLSADRRWVAIDMLPLALSKKPEFSLIPRPLPVFQASVSLDLPVGEYSFTYRLSDRLDGSLQWLGDEHSNGTLVIQDTEVPCLAGSTGWQNDIWLSPVRAWSNPDAAASHPVARFSPSHAVHGFAITQRSHLFIFRATNTGFVTNSDAASNRNGPPDELLAAVVLFSNVHGPLLFSGDQLMLRSQDSSLILYSRRRAQLRRHVNGQKLADALALVSDISVSDCESTDFISLVNSSTKTMFVLPISEHPSIQTIIRLQGLDKITSSSATFTLYDAASQQAAFISTPTAHVLVPPEGGCISVSSAVALRDGELVAVLSPATLSPRFASTRVSSLRNVARNRGLFSVPMLFAIVSYILTTILRSVFGIRRFEEFLLGRVFNWPLAPIVNTTERLAKDFIGTSYVSDAAHSNAAVFVLSRGGEKLPTSATILAHRPIGRGNGYANGRGHDSATLPFLAPQILWAGYVVDPRNVTQIDGNLGSSLLLDLDLPVVPNIDDPCLQVVY